MNVAQPIDVNRILRDNQRMHHEMTLSQDRYQKMLNQIQQLFTENLTLKTERDNLKQTHLEQIELAIANNKSIYEKELNVLRSQNHQLRSQIEGLGDQQQVNNNLQTTVERLKLQLEKHEYENEIIRQQCEQLRKLADNTEKQERLEQIQIQFRRTKDQFNQQGIKLIQLQMQNKRLHKEQQNSKNKINEGKTIINSLQSTLKEESQKYAQLQKQHQQIVQKSPQWLINELHHLRAENAELKDIQEKKLITACDKDDDIFNLLQQFHRELTLLRLQLNEAKAKSEQNTVELYNERAQTHLIVIKFEKEQQFIKKENIILKEKLKQSEKCVSVKKKEENVSAKLIQEISILKIKVFVLESMKISERYRRIQSKGWEGIEDKKNIYSALSLNQNISEIVQSFIQLNSIIKELKERLIQQERSKNSAIRKYRSYKQKYLCLNKSVRQGDNSKDLLIQNLKLKMKDYNKLIERLQEELQKSVDLNGEMSERSHNHLVIASYEQQIDSMNTSIIVLQNQIKHQEFSMHQDKQKYQKDIQQLQRDNNRLNDQNTQLTTKLRSAETQILQNSLTTDANRSADIKNYQSDIAAKTTIIINLQKELQNARRQFQTDLQTAVKDQEHAKIKLERDLERSKSQAANALFKSNITSQNLNNSELEQVKQKLKFLEKRMEQQGGEDKNNYVIKLNKQIHIVREELQRQRYSHDQKTNQLNSYKIRVIELEDALKVVSHDSEQKAKQIANVNAECQAMAQHIEKLEEQITIIRGQGGSLKQIQYIDLNNELHESKEKLQTQIITIKQQKQQLERQNEKLRRDCDTFEQENFRLLVVAKQNNFHSKQNSLLTQKYENERDYKTNQLQNKINNLTSENGILKDLIEELRSKLLEKQQSRMSESSKSNQLEDVRNQLIKYQKDAKYYKQEYERMLEDRHREKDAFETEWNKLVAELKILRQQVQTQQKQQEGRKTSPAKEIKKVQFNLPEIIAQKQSLSQSSRLFTIQTQFEKQIYQLNSKIDQKNSVIDKLQMEIDNLKYESTHTDTVGFDEVLSLREQNQKLLQHKYSDEAKIRMLEQEIMSLKVKRISEDVQVQDIRLSTNVLGSSQQAFASNRNSLIHQLGFQEGQDLRRELAQSQHYIELINSKFAENTTIQKRYEESLLMLVMAWAEMESLRQRLIDAERKIQEQFTKYTDGLNDFRGRDSDSFQSKNKANTSLIKQIECSHQHLMQLTNGGLQQKKTDPFLYTGTSLYQNSKSPYIGTFNYGSIESKIVNGKNLLESYSFPEGDVSPRLVM